MRTILLAFFFTIIVLGVSDAQVHVAGKYSYPLLPGTPADSVLHGLKSIRACAFAADVDGDGKSELAVTNYAGNGRVSIFEAAGDDSIRLVWTSPKIPGALSTGDTPRFLTFGDLDNDGKKEIIYHISGVGFLIFEWDGVVGSDNYGTSWSQILGAPYLPATLQVRYVEYFEVLDIDGDGINELVTAYDSYLGPNSDDQYLVINADGDWSTDDPGFSSFNVKYRFSRTAPSANAYGFNGTPIAMISANFDGVGNKEILIHNWNLKNVVPMRVTGPGTFVLPDTNTRKQNYKIGGADDDVALMGGMAYDIDGDGREEVYLPTFPASGSKSAGYVHMVSYDAGQSTAIIDSTNVTRLTLGKLALTTFGYGYGDMDGNGKKELYFTSTYPANVISLEYQGGGKRDTANWKPRILYAGDSTLYGDTEPPDPFAAAFVYTDSLGIRRDSVKRIDPSFPSKIYGRLTDFDRDGKEDIIMGYQALADTLTTVRRTWNSGTAKYDSVITKQANPKRWALRIIEKGATTGIEVKDLTIITPEDYRLEQNYPNPFNPSTTIAFSLPVKQRISLQVFDILGREVRTLINNEEFPSGTARVTWDGKNNSGKQAVSGTYFYRLKFGNFEKTNKMLLLK